MSSISYVSRMPAGRMGRPTILPQGLPEDLLRQRGAAQLQGVIRLYRSHSAVDEKLIEHLGILADSAADIRVRYASLLLLEKNYFRVPGLAERVLSGLNLMALREDILAINEGGPAEREKVLLAMLPKTDLHVHLDGSVRLETIMGLAESQGIDLAQVLERSKKDKAFALADVPALPARPSFEDIRRLSQITDVQPDFLKMLFLGFDFAIAVMQTPEALERIAYELVEDSWREGVMHLTTIFAPVLHLAKGLTYDEAAKAVIAGLERGKKDFGVSWELALAIYRGTYAEMFPEHPDQTAAAAKRLAKKYPEQIAIDVVGAEFQMPQSAFARQFADLAGSGVILRAHAGELPGHGFNIKAAFELGARRIGHGIYLDELAPDDIKRIIEAGVTFEVSPVSNVKCHAVSQDETVNRLENHPLRRLIAAGAQVALCTDDRTVVDTDHLRQLAALESAMRLTAFSGGMVSRDYGNLAANGFRAIADQAVSSAALKEMDGYFAGINDLRRILG